jgi:hypothetical protein
MYLPRSRLGSDEKVNVAVYMTDACVHVCVDSVKDRNHAISEEQLVKRVRERINFGKRSRREV